MKCRICKREARVALKSHNTAFCETCFLEFFSRQVSRAIESQGLMTHDDRVLVALSGGKDSLALMHELARQGYHVTGLHLDLGIGKSSRLAREAVEDFCHKEHLSLLVKDLASEHLAIPGVKEALRRPICSACGSIKRYYFNKVAMDEGFTVLATGHNLDDEVARLFSNTLRWDTCYLGQQGPRLEAEDGFVRKVKPLWRLTEYETANYAFLCNIQTHYAPCPFSSGASFSVLKSLMQRLEFLMPGRKIDFYQGFLKRGRPVFASLEAQRTTLHACAQCGYPTSADELCQVCRIREQVAKKRTNKA
ncbi:MAG: TIGR00269 family protein [Desulfovibrio sp.]|nr:TIGR00269 family protein [Desulfovibrio sp.]